MAPPRGRRPVGYVWDARSARWLSLTTGEPLNGATYMEGVRARRRACDHRRYWDEGTGVRQQRKVRARLERKRPPKPLQSTLEELTRCVCGRLPLEGLARAIKAVAPESLTIGRVWIS